MMQEAISQTNAARRCPNCGTRVAQNAETCYFCGHDLTKEPRSRRRLSWTDLLLVLALLSVVVFWWRMANDFGAQETTADASALLQTPSGTTPGTDAAAPTVLSDEDEGRNVAVVVTPTVDGLSNPYVVTHRVESGETLLGISEQYGVAVEEIQGVNELEDELIRAGDELLIPVPESVAETTDDTSAVSSIFRYVVQPGDTIVSLAIRFGTQVARILEANGLSQDEFIRPEQTLTIPVDRVPSAVISSADAARTAEQPDLQAYDSPQLLDPQADATLPSAEQVLFRWMSVDLLASNEWYVLSIWPLEGTTTVPPTIWTKSTSYRLDPEWAPAQSRARYGWQVTVVRVLPDQGEGREIEAASAPSEVRTFYWQ